MFVHTRACRLPSLLALGKRISLKNGNDVQLLAKRFDHDPTLPIRSSRWEWHKFWDEVHFFTLLGLIPSLAVIGYCNLFIGSAQLSEIPDDYEPRHYEYFKHPITRFMAKHLAEPYQKKLEKKMGLFHHHAQKEAFSLEDLNVNDMERWAGDFRGWYYVPVNTNVINAARHKFDVYETYDWHPQGIQQKVRKVDSNQQKSD